MFGLFRFLIGSVLIGLTSLVFSTQAQIKGSASIAGTVTLGGKPAKGVAVIATLTGTTVSGQRPPTSSSTSDDEGHYRISGLAAGRYLVAPYQPTGVLPERTAFDTGSKTVTLGENEGVSDLNFTLSLGGVITGRILGPDGRPLIEERITIQSADGKQTFGGLIGNEMYLTDDRGIYRIYGLPSGRYLVSVGDDKSGSGMVYGPTNSGYFPRTFYPGTTERSDAKIIELSEGSAESGIDINVGPREKAFSISGRMVDQSTGKPVPDIPVGYGALKPGQNGVDGFGFSTSSDASGYFKLNSLKPGRYSVFPAQSFDGQSKWIGDPVTIEITDDNVEGVELHLRAGATIDGIAVVEGTTDPDILKRVSQLRIQLWARPSESNSAPSFRTAQIRPDNTFHVEGLAPGVYSVSIPQPSTDQVFSLRGVEQDGNISTNGSIQLPQGIDRANVRLLIDSGTGIIRGQVNVIGGEIPTGWRLSGAARRAGQPGAQPRMLNVDARGRFIIEHLAAGEYEISVNVFPASPQSTPPQGPFPSTRQTVTVTGTGEASVILTLNLGQSRTENQQ
jgi:hypothetical protein